MSEPTTAKEQLASERRVEAGGSLGAMIVVMLFGPLIMWFHTFFLLAVVPLGVLGLWPTIRVLVYKRALLPLVMPALPFAGLAGVLVGLVFMPHPVTFVLLVVAAFFFVGLAQSRIARMSEPAPDSFKLSDPVREAPASFKKSARWTVFFLALSFFGVQALAHSFTDSFATDTLLIRIVTGVCLAVAIFGAYAELMAATLHIDRERVEGKIAAFMSTAGIRYTPASRDELVRQHRSDITSSLLSEPRERLSMELAGPALGGLWSLFFYLVSTLLYATPGLNMFFGPMVVGWLYADEELATFTDRVPGPTTSRGADFS